MDSQDRAGTELPLDLRDPARRQDPPAVDDRHAGADLLELGEDVAADQDRLAERPQFAEQLAQLDARPRVEPRGRLVEEEDRRIVDEGVGEAEPLLHAAAEGLDVGVALFGEVDQVEQVADHLAPPPRRQPVAAGEEVEVLPDLHVVVDAEGVGHVADDPPRGGRLAADRDAADEGVAGGRREERGEHAQRRRLACAVRPHQAEDLVLADDQVEPADGEGAVEALGQAPRLDDGAHSITPSRRTPKLK